MKILLIGFYGEGNLGDEAILKSIKSNIPTPATLYVTAGKNYCEKDGILRRGILSWSQFIKTAIICDKAILSGGILQDWTTEGVLFFALRIFASSILKCKPSLWGAGIGPLRSKPLISITKKALKHLECAWLRDEKSLNLYKSLNGHNVNYGTDWTWYYQACSSKTIKSNQVMVNIRPWKYGSEHNFDDINLKDIKSKTLIGVSARNEDNNELLKTFPGISIYQPENYEKLLSFCSNYNNGIAMRYHVALAMLRTGVKTTLIPYDSKVSELCKAQKNLNKFLYDNHIRFNNMQKEFKTFLA